MEKQKILLLTDLKEGSKNILESTVLLAKKINADIKVLHIKRPIDIVKQESQLSAQRILNKEQNTITKRVKMLIEPFQKDQGTNITGSFSVGNIKNEIKDSIKGYSPDLIVLGKKKANSFSIIGDKLTNYILANYKGKVLIADKDHTLKLDKDANYGMVNSNQELLSNTLNKKLLTSSDKPLKTYRVVSKYDKGDTSLKTSKDNEYVFEHNDNVFNSISNYLSKQNINLLFLNRDSLNKKQMVSSEVRQIVQKATVPILIS